MVLLQQDSVSKFNLLGYIKRVLNGSESQKSWIKRWVGRYNLEGFIRPMRVGGSIKLGMGIMIHMTQAGPPWFDHPTTLHPNPTVKKVSPKAGAWLPPHEISMLCINAFSFLWKRPLKVGRKEGKFQTFFPSLWKLI